jgi:predicted RNase H-like nuclease (RuvC/YqgF family)
VRPKVEDTNADANEQLRPTLGSQEMLEKVHSCLLHISHLTRGCYDELVRHCPRYHQAYLTEQAKLADTVAMYRSLENERERLDQENRCYQRQVVPDQDRLISRQEREIHELQKKLQHSEASRDALEAKRCEELDEHAKATEAMLELLTANDEKAQGREAEQSTAGDQRVLSRLRPRNGDRFQNAAAGVSGLGAPVSRDRCGRKAKRA